MGRYRIRGLWTAEEAFPEYGIQNGDQVVELESGELLVRPHLGWAALLKELENEPNGARADVIRDHIELEGAVIAFMISAGEGLRS